jgi:hypothetical protein
MLYSFGYCCGDPVGGTIPGENDVGVGETDGTADAQLRTKGFVELGIVTDPPFPPLLICVRTDAACAGVANVRKQ